MSTEKREVVKNGTDADGDQVIAALDELTTAVEANARDGKLLVRRVDELRKARAKGKPWWEVLGQERKPGVLDLVGRMLNRLGESSSGVRRPLASAMRREGLTIPAVAHIFGVSHQRVSTLLRRNRE
jgi:hypothetical protein